MNKNRFSKYFIFLSLFTFLSLFILIAGNSYNRLIGPVNQARDDQLIKPIDPNLDLEVLEIIEKRQSLDYEAGN